jgi:hypothetical protein
LHVAIAPDIAMEVTCCGWDEVTDRGHPLEQWQNLSVSRTSFSVEVTITATELYKGLLVKPSLATNIQDVFILYSLFQHVSANLMAILKRIIQNIKGSCYFYNGPIVLSTNMCESCRQLIAVVFLCIKVKLNLIQKEFNT